MGRLNIYVPDDLADAARRAGLNVSRVTQEGLQHELTLRRLDAWFQRLGQLPEGGASREDCTAAVRAARGGRPQ